MPFLGLIFGFMLYYKKWGNQFWLNYKGVYQRVSRNLWPFRKSGLQVAFFCETQALAMWCASNGDD